MVAMLGLLIGVQAMRAIDDGVRPTGPGSHMSAQPVIPR